MEAVMSGSKVAVGSACQLGCWLVGIVILGATAVLAIPAQAQESAPSLNGRVVVMGEGTISVAPDYAQIVVGVTTRGKTVKEANDANTKLMAAVTSTLLGIGIAQKDVQTTEFSVQPVYAQQDSHGQQKLDGYSVLNQVNVRIHQIEKVGDILDSLVPAGVTDVGNITFLVSDPSKASTRPAHRQSPMQGIRPRSTRRHRAFSLGELFRSRRTRDLLSPS
jgi:uncharacterized protein YggE